MVWGLELPKKGGTILGVHNKDLSMFGVYIGVSLCMEKTKSEEVGNLALLGCC